MTWEDFLAIYQPFLDEMEKTTSLLQQAEKIWQSLPATYQEYIDYMEGKRWQR